MENENTSSLKKKDLLVFAKTEIAKLLSNTMPIKFVKSELYTINEQTYLKLLEIDKILSPNKKGTRKTDIYSINTFVNILNPNDVAVLFTLTPVLKRKQIADFNKIKAQLGRELAVSAKLLKQDFEEYTKNNDLSEFAYDKKQKELDARLNLEKEYFDLINSNPEHYMNNKLKIATNPVLHGQIRYYFINQNGIKEDVQKHLSSELPNILVFDENSSSKKRKDNKIDLFMKDSIRIFGNVYMKKD